MKCPNCGIIDDHTDACLSGKVIGHSESFREAPRQDQENTVRLLNRLAAGEDVSSEYQQMIMKMHSAQNKAAWLKARGGVPIDWSHEMDVALIKSSMGDMHNFFVFCRTYDVFTDDAFARHKCLKASDNFKKLSEEARALFNSEEGERKANADICAKILSKGAPASADDKNWLARANWPICDPSGEAKEDKPLHLEYTILTKGDSHERTF